MKFTKTFFDTIEEKGLVHTNEFLDSQNGARASKYAITDSSTNFLAKHLDINIPISKV